MRCHRWPLITAKLVEHSLGVIHSSILPSLKHTRGKNWATRTAKSTLALSNHLARSVYLFIGLSECWESEHPSMRILVRTKAEVFPLSDVFDRDVLESVFAFSHLHAQGCLCLNSWFPDPSISITSSMTPRETLCVSGQQGGDSPKWTLARNYNLHGLRCHTNSLFGWYSLHTSSLA